MKKISAFIIVLLLALMCCSCESKTKTENPAETTGKKTAEETEQTESTAVQTDSPEEPFESEKEEADNSLQQLKIQSDGPVIPYSLDRNSKKYPDWYPSADYLFEKIDDAYYSELYFTSLIGEENIKYIDDHGLVNSDIFHCKNDIITYLSGIYSSKAMKDWEKIIDQRFYDQDGELCFHNLSPHDLEFHWYRIVAYDIYCPTETICNLTAIVHFGPANTYMSYTYYFELENGKWLINHQSEIINSNVCGKLPGTGQYGTAYITHHTYTYYYLKEKYPFMFSSRK